MFQGKHRGYAMPVIIRFLAIPHTLLRIWRRIQLDDLILGTNDDSYYDNRYVEFDSKLAQQYIEIYKERFQKYKVESKSLKR